MQIRRSERTYDFAVKEIKTSRTEMRKSRIRQESDFGLRVAKCPFAVATYGIMEYGNDVRIIMELMDDSVSNLVYKVNYYKFDRLFSFNMTQIYCLPFIPLCRER